MGEETVKTDTLEIGTDTTEQTELNKKNSEKEIDKDVPKAQLEDDDKEADGGAGSDVPNENCINKKDSDKNEDASTNGIDSENKTEETKNTNGEIPKEENSVEEKKQEFKLRLVPLERLLCSAKKAALEKEKEESLKREIRKEKANNVVRKLLPERSKRSKLSIIEISSSDSSSSASEDEEPVKQVVAEKKKTETSTTSQEKDKATQKAKKPENSIKSIPEEPEKEESIKSSSEEPEKEKSKKANSEEPDKENSKKANSKEPEKEKSKKSNSEEPEKENSKKANSKEPEKEKSKKSNSEEPEKEKSKKLNSEEPEKEKSKKPNSKEPEKEKSKKPNSKEPEKEKSTKTNSKEPEKEKSKKSKSKETEKKKSTSSNADPRVKRCVVRIKRIPWPNQANKSNKTEKQKKTQKDKTETRKETGRKTRFAAASNRKRLRSPSTSISSSRRSSVTSNSAAEPSTSKMEKPSSSKKRKKHISDSDSDSDFELNKETKNNSEEEHESNASDEQKENDDGSDDGGSNDDIKSSDSEIIPKRKKRVFNKKKKSGSDDSDFEPKSKRSAKPKKQRRRIKRGSSDDDGSDNDDDDGSGKDKNKHKRKDIRKIIKTKDLDLSTKEAAKEEDERRKRIEERQKLYNQIYERRETEEITELVLDFDEESKEALLQVDAGLLKKLKPHQVAGVKFMWDACFETLTDTVEKPGSGCILAHCMGLGKTLQIVTLSHTLLANSRKTNVERVLIISPLSTLNNWAREFKQWMNFTRKRNIEIYDMSRYKDKNTRIFKLTEWYEEGGVCIIGYDLYRILANEKAKGLKKKQREGLQQSLVDPGPDLVVCDEGHLLKNEKTSISKAVTRMRTRRRIVLTGTPLQNNLKEYYCMIQFIKPNLLGTYKEYLNRFVNPITNGQYTDSTERDIRLMRHRSHILHKLLEGCIQRRDYSVLAPYLPPKHEYVIYTTLSELQQELYEYYMTTYRDVNTTDICGKGARLFQDFQDLRRIWTHPMNLRVNSDLVIRKRLMADEENSLEDFICDDDDDDDESGGGGGGRGGRGYNSSASSDDVDSSKSFASGNNAASGSKSRKTRRSKQLTNGNESDDSDSKGKDGNKADDPSEWWKRFADEAALNNLHHSPKLVMLMRLLQQCEEIGDKLLVFSQSLQSLDVIEHFLSLINRKTCGEDIEGDVGDIKGRWRLGTDYFRLDGSCSVENREDMCKRFNNASNLRARLFLISTRAGGLGINLVAANRVVIFDVSWNPSHDTQSIFRVYRFGQEKPCYIYRLIAMGTMEQKVYERQVTKQATAKRVIDEQQISRHYNQSDLQELYTYELKPTVQREVPLLPKDRLFAELLSDYEGLIFKYHEHDSLLENEDSENLSEEDRKAAWSEYEAEKTRATQTAQYVSYDRSAYANTTGSVTSSRIFGFRSDVLLHLLNLKVAQDNPEFNQNQITQLVPAYLDRLYNEMHNNDPTMYRELLDLNASLIQPGGMFMNPLLYANQNPQAAGYYQAPHIQQQPETNILGLPTMPIIAPRVPPPVVAPGFNTEEVYEID